VGVKYQFNRFIFCIPRQSAVDDVIDTMDNYYLSKEDWDTIVELGVDEKKDDIVLKKVSTATKTALTRKFVPHLQFPIMRVFYQRIFTGNFFLVDTTRASIPYPSTRPKTLERCLRNLPGDLRQISKKHM